MTCFILIPLFSLILEGFRSSDGSITFNEFWDVLDDGRSIRIMIFTLEQALISTAATIILAVPGAYLLNRYRFPGRSVLLSLTTVPFILPPLVLAIGFFTLFGTSGHINSFISDLEVLSGLELPAVDVLYSIKGIVLAHVFLNFPVALRLIYSRFEHLDPDLEKASRSLGSGPLMTFFRVLLPQMKYTLLASISLVFTFCFLSFGVILVIGGGTNQTMETEIYRQFSGMLDFPRAGIFLLIETVIVAFSTVIYVWASGRSEVDLGYGPSIERSSKRSGRIGKAGLIISIVYSIFMVVIIIGPLISVVWESFILDGSFSLHFFEQVVSRELDPSMGISPLEAVLNSLIFAFLSSIISVPVSIGIGYFLHRKGGAVKIPMDVLLLMPIGISTIGLGYGLINAYSGTVWDPTGTWYVIVIVHVMLSYPFGARAVHSGLSSIPGNLRKASRSLGQVLSGHSFQWSCLCLLLH